MCIHIPTIYGFLAVSYFVRLSRKHAHLITNVPRISCYIFYCKSILVFVACASVTNVFCLQFLACNEPPPRRIKEVPTERWDKPPYPHSTKVTYRCRPGYIKLGRIVFECDDGEWKQLPPATECRSQYLCKIHATI